MLYFEHKHLYRRIKGEVPDTDYTTPFGKARVHREGEAVTVVATGRLVDAHHRRRPRSDEIIVALRSGVPAAPIESVIARLREGPLRLTSPPCSVVDFASALYFIFVEHPMRKRRHGIGPRQGHCSHSEGPR